MQKESRNYGITMSIEAEKDEHLMIVMKETLMTTVFPSGAPTHARK